MNIPEPSRGMNIEVDWALSGGLRYCLFVEVDHKDNLHKR